jgi:hypothetical protein
LLLAAVVIIAVLAVVAPGAALVGAVILAVAFVAAVAEGSGAPVSWFDIGLASDRKRDVLTRCLKRGRPEWETTPPDHADEHPDAVWERERKRRGLG